MTANNPRDRPRMAMPPLAAAYFVVGIAWLVMGIALGIQMAASHDFVLRPVHAHANLLGWATNALFGCFFWLRGGAARAWEWLGLAAYNIGGAVMLGGLTALLLDRAVPPAAMPVSTTLIAVGVLQMVVAIVSHSRHRA